MSITLAAADYTAIETHGQETFPNECCGFMLGTKAENGDRVATELMPAENSREEENQYNRFEITPQDFMRAEKKAIKSGLELLGFYHSHPDAPAKPSQFDLDHAWPVYSYVIVSILEGKADNMTSWIMKDDRSGYNEESIEKSGA